MKTTSRKTYFTFVNSDEYGYYWLGQNGDILRFPGQPKFIVQALVRKFGPKKGKQVFENFMAGMEELDKLEIPNNWKNPPAGFVLYHKNKDVNKGYESGYSEKIYDGEEEY